MLFGLETLVKFGTQNGIRHEGVSVIAFGRHRRRLSQDACGEA